MHALLIRLQSNWMRNLLAVLQVAAATAAVSAVLTTVIPALLARPVAEPDLLRVQYGFETEYGGSYTSAFTASDVVYLEQEADSVAAASLFLNHYVTLVRVGEDRYAVQGMGEVSPGYAQTHGIDMLHGSFFLQSDLEQTGASPPAVISDRLALTLFGREDVVGETINLRPERERSLLMGHMSGNFDQQAILGSPGLDLKVVGVFRYSDQGESLYESDPHLLVPVGVHGQLQVMASGPVMAASSAVVVVSGTAVMSEGVAMDGTDLRNMEITPMQAPEQTYSELFVKPRPGMARQAEQEVAALLRSRVSGRNQGAYLASFGSPFGGSESQDFDVLVSDAARDWYLIRQYQLQSSLLTGAMGLAALIVAGFAVFTTTMANLTERTRSIGLSRSLGATRGHILREVVFESMLLSAIGGVLGALVAYPFGKYVVGPWQGVIGDLAWAHVVSAGLVGLLLAVLVGALAAIFPAWSVAQLMPAEALREGRS